MKYPIFILCHYYRRYVRSKEGAEKRDITTTSTNEVEIQDFTSVSADLEIKRPKQTKIEHQKVEEKPCIICNKIKMEGDVTRYRICEIKRAK